MVKMEEESESSSGLYKLSNSDSLSSHSETSSRILRKDERISSEQNVFFSP